jgi:hypothetical protein
VKTFHKCRRSVVEEIAKKTIQPKDLKRKIIDINPKYFLAKYE